MTVYKPKGSRFFQYDFQAKKVRHTGSTGVETRRKAEAVERRVREQVALGIDPNSTDTWDYAVGRYWTEVGQHRKSASIIKHRLAIVLRLFGPATQLTDIGTSAAAIAMEKRRGETYVRAPDKPPKDGQPAKKAARYSLANSTVNSDVIKPARAILNRARKVWKVNGLQEINWPDLVLGEVRTPIVHFADDYQRRWIDACGPTEAYALELLLRYGMRFGELFFPPSAYLPDFPNGAAVAVNERKNGEPVLILLTEADARQIAARAGVAAAAGLKSIWIERGPPGQTAKGEVEGDLVDVAYHALQSRLRTAAERAGIDHKRLIHSVRHHVGTDMLAKTGDLAMTQAALRHHDIKSTLVYAHALDNGLRAAIESRNSPEAAKAEGEFSAPKQRRKKS